MLFFLAIIGISLVINVLGVKYQAGYYELDGAATEAYLFIGKDDGNKVYICKK